MATVKKVLLPAGILTQHDVQRLTGASDRTVRQWLNSGKLPVFRPAGMIGKRRFVELEKLKRFARREGIELREGIEAR